MNVIITTSVLLFSVRAGAVELLKQSGYFESGEHEKWNPNPITAVVNSDFGNEMNSTAHVSVTNFYCVVEEIQDPDIILYGTKSWTFPAQDVNLTLSYPSDNSRSQQSLLSSEDERYLITGFKVTLYIDGMDTKGFIMDGGVMQESIVLTFVSRNTKSLSYQFWLFGTPKNTSAPYAEMNSQYYMC